MTYLSDLALSLQPYVPGEQPKDGIFIKLNTNENPYPPSPLLKSVLDELDPAAFRLYPPPECEALRDEIAAYHGVKRENVYVANGSDELLAWCFPAFYTGKDPILINDITYSFYKVYCAMFQVEADIVPLNDDFSIPIEQYLNRNRGILLANPNAPTGQRLSPDLLERIVKTNREQVVVVDEAYGDFGGESAVSLTKTYEHVLVVQTLSKSRSMAGIRVGFAIGSKPLIEGLARIKNSINSYTMDSISLKLAAAAIKDKVYFEETVKKIIATRERITPLLRAMGFVFADSDANFLFVTHAKKKASDLFRGLREKGILVRYFNQPRIDNHLRITIGTDEQMDALILALAELTAEE